MTLRSPINDSHVLALFESVAKKVDIFCLIFFYSLLCWINLVADGMVPVAHTIEVLLGHNLGLFQVYF